MVCIIRDEPSAVPKRWVGMIVGAGDHRLSPLPGRPLLDPIIEKARPQISSLVICTTADADASPVSVQGLPAVAPERDGLLAAIVAGLDWTARHSRETPWLATFAADAPVFPADLVERLGLAVGAEGADMAWVDSATRSGPAFGLWPVRLRRALGRAIERHSGFGVAAWSAGLRVARVALSPATDTRLSREIS